MDEKGLVQLLSRVQDEGVEYVLVGGHAVRLNGFLRATEDIDILLPSSVENGRRVIRALSFLPSSSDLRPEWFDVSADEPENIRVADELLVDLLFAANGHTYESLKAHIRIVDFDGIDVRTLDPEGLLMTKTSYRDKDRVDRAVLGRLAELGAALRRIKLQTITGSDAVRQLGFDPDHRMAVVVYTGSDTAYGYPNLSDEEIAGLLAVLQNHKSLGHYVSTVIKKKHDHERVQL